MIPGRLVPVLALATAALVGVAWLAPTAVPVLLRDSLHPLLLLVGAAGWGAWPLRWAGLSDGPAGRQCCVAVALGLGLLSTLTLALGAMGLLSAPTAWTLVALGGVCGLTFLARRRAPATDDDGAPGGPEPPSWSTLLLLPLALPLAVMLFGATLPPGLLWEDEARGYDVLEYHLQVPREYFQARRIHFLPHNVYAQFPQQVEMLYLLLMFVKGQPHAAAIPAQMLHSLLAALVVLAIHACLRPGWRAVLGALTAGSVPWLAYLGCLAYVEAGMLFFAAVAAGLLMLSASAASTSTDAATTDLSRRGRAARLALLGGVCAGLAGGCKYTALVLIAAGLGLAFALAAPLRAGIRWRLASRYALGVLLAFAPWALRNAVFTGNPIYPFAYAWLDGAAWSAEQARQWAAGHRPPADRWAVAVRELLGGRDPRGGWEPSLFGGLIYVAAGAGAVMLRSRWSLVLGIWAVLILLAWSGLTHMPGRFAVPLLVPLSLLAGGAAAPIDPAGRSRGSSRRQPGWTAALLLGFAGTAAALQGAWLARRLADEAERWRRRTDVPLARMAGQTRLMVETHRIHARTPPDACVWVVGDAAMFYVDRRVHYTVVFNRDPWLEHAAHADAAECVEWLRSRNVTHVVFSWAEIRRLRRTYGFSDLPTREWVERLIAAGMQRVAAEVAQPSAADSESGQEPRIVWEILALPVAGGPGSGSGGLPPE